MLKNTEGRLMPAIVMNFARTNVLLKKLRAGPNKKKHQASDFHVKKSMAWMPHLLTDGHVPSCPTCGTNAGRLSFDLLLNVWSCLPGCCTASLFKMQQTIQGHQFKVDGHG